MDYPYQMDGFPNPFETIKRKKSFEIINPDNFKLDKKKYNNDINVNPAKKFKINNYINKVKNSDNDNSPKKKLKIQ